MTFHNTSLHYLSVVSCNRRYFFIICIHWWKYTSHKS